MDGERLTMEVQHQEQAARVFLRGELDAASAGSLRLLLETIVAGGVELVEIDLAATTFIDSAGLSALLTPHRLGAQLRVLRPSARAAHLLELVALESIIEIAGDESGDELTTA